MQWKKIAIALLFVPISNLFQSPVIGQEVDSDLYKFCFDFPHNSRCEDVEIPITLEQRLGTNINCWFDAVEKNTSQNCKIHLADDYATIYFEVGEPIEFLDGVYDTQELTIQASDMLFLNGFRLTTVEMVNYKIIGRRQTTHLALFYKVSPENQLGNYLSMLRMETSLIFEEALRDFFENKTPNLSLEAFHSHVLSNQPSPTVLPSNSEDSGSIASNPSTSSNSEALTPLNQLLSTNSCVRCDLSGVNLRGEDLDRANLGGANLAGADLTGAELEGAYLLGANLTGANLEDADLDRANLFAATLVEANLQDAKLRTTILQFSDFQNANLNDTDLSGFTWAEFANFDGASFESARLVGANLKDTSFENANLQEASFKRTNLTLFGENWFIPRSGLEYTRWGRILTSTQNQLTSVTTRLNDANLRGTDFSNADLQGVVFHGADLNGALFINADLDNANFNSANLTDANFRGADWDDVSLGNANLCRITMPDGTISAAEC